MDSDLWTDESPGDVCLLFDRVLLSPRFKEVVEVEEFVCGGAEGGWVVRAREDRRGLMVQATEGMRKGGQVCRYLRVGLSEVVL